MGGWEWRGRREGVGDEGTSGEGQEGKMQRRRRGKAKSQLEQGTGVKRGREEAWERDARGKEARDARNLRNPGLREYKEAGE